MHVLLIAEIYLTQVSGFPSQMSQKSAAAFSFAVIGLKMPGVVVSGKLAKSIMSAS